MQRTICRLVAFAAAFSIIFIPCFGTWSGWTAGALLMPLPPPLQARYCYLPLDAFCKAMRFLRTHRFELNNTRFMTIIDYTEPSTSKRLFLINMESGKVRRLLVSHGKNSGGLYATRFSNRPGSYESPRGFFITGSEYYGSHGPSLVLYGLQKGINDNSVSRGIVMHGAYYVGWEAIAINRARGRIRLGRSLGCPAIPMRAAQSVIDKIKDGSLLYMYAGGR